MVQSNYISTNSLCSSIFSLTLICLIISTGPPNSIVHSNPTAKEAQIGELIVQYSGSADSNGKMAKNEKYLLASFGRHINIFEANTNSYSNPIQTLSLNGDIYSLKITNDSAYILTSHGLEIWDITDGAAPSQIGAANVPKSNGQSLISGPFLMEVLGDTVYFLQNKHYYGDQSNTLYIVDISDPTRPQQISEQAVKSRSMIGYQDQFLILENYLYEIPQMEIYSTKDPSNLEMIGDFSPDPTDGNVIIIDMALTADYLYALSWDIGEICTGMCQRPRTLHVLNPQTLEPLSSQYFDSAPPINQSLMTVDDKLLAFFDWSDWSSNDEARIWSLTSPLSPEWNMNITVEGNVNSTIDIDNAVITFMNSNELVHYDLNDLENIERNVLYQSLGFLYTDVSSNLETMVGIGNDKKLRILDIANLQEPNPQFKATLDKDYVGLTMANNLVYSVWFNHAGEASHYTFEILDISDAQNPTRLGTTSLTNPPYFDDSATTEVQIINNQAHILFETPGKNQNGLFVGNEYTYMIIDISDPQAPQQQDVFTKKERIFDFSVSQNDVFLRDERGIFKLDISDTNQFVELGYFLKADNKNHPSRPVIHNNHLYVAEVSSYYLDSIGWINESKILIFDLTNSSSEHIGELALNNSPTGMWIFEEELHIASAESDLLNIYSLENPLAPKHNAWVGSSPNLIFRNEGTIMTQNHPGDGFKIYQLDPITSRQFLPVINQ